MIEHIWLGELTALKELISLQTRMQEAFLSPNPMHMERIGKFEAREGQGSFDEDELFSHMTQRYGIQGRTGIIRVSGPMVHESRWWHTYMGVTSYEAIAASLETAAMDPDIDTVVLHIRSPGGMVMGLDTVNEAMENAKAQGLRIFAYTDQIMASAGYWVGSGAEKIGASKMARIGSVGVIYTHMSIQRYLAEEGVDVEVFRIGENKARGSQFEQLTDGDREDIMKELQVSYDMLLDQVAEGRKGKVDRATLPELTEHGRLFHSQAAHQKNLIDFVDSLKNLLVYVDQNVNNNEQQPTIIR